MACIEQAPFLCSRIGVRQEAGERFGEPRTDQGGRELPIRQGPVADRLALHLRYEVREVRQRVGLVSGQLVDAAALSGLRRQHGAGRRGVIRACTAEATRPSPAAPRKTPCASAAGIEASARAESRPHSSRCTIHCAAARAARPTRLRSRGAPPPDQGATYKGRRIGPEDARIGNAWVTWNAMGSSRATCTRPALRALSIAWPSWVAPSSFPWTCRWIGPRTATDAFGRRGASTMTSKVPAPPEPVDPDRDAAEANG